MRSLSATDWIPFTVLLEPWFVITTGLLTVGALAFTSRKSSETRFRIPANPHAILPVLFLGLLAFFWVGVEQEDRETTLTGDEPHYLFIMESLNRYGTADLSRLTEDRDFSEGVRRVRPHRAPMSKPGTTYSVHHIGLPLLLAPLHRAEGYSAVMVVMTLSVVFLCCNLFLYLTELGGRPMLSLLLTLLFALTAPVIFYFRYVFPDPLAACLVLYAYRQYRKPEASLGSYALACMLTAYLPWLHVKYLLLAITLAGVAVWPRRRQWKPCLLLGVCLAASGIPMMLFFQHAFGSWLPNAQYGDTSAPFSFLFWRGAIGQLLDRDHGLFAWSPYLLIGLLGLQPLWKQQRGEAIRILLLILPSFILVSSHWMWWGGPCPAGRFFLPFWALLFPFILYGLPALRHPFLLPLGIVAIIFSLAIGFHSYLDPRYLSFHKHNAYGWFPTLHAYPPFPLFAVHRRYEFPWISFATLPLLLACAGFLFLMGKRAFILPRHPRPLCALGFATALLLPGVLASVQQRIDAHHWLLNDINRRFVRDACALRRNIPQPEPFHLDRDEKGNAKTGDVSPEHPRWFMTGGFLTFYPGVHNIEVHIRATGVPGTTVGMVDAAAFMGEDILDESPVVIHAGEAEQVIRLHVPVTQRLDHVEIRARLNGPGEIHVTGIDIRLSSAIAPERDAAR